MPRATVRRALTACTIATGALAAAGVWAAEQDQTALPQPSAQRTEIFLTAGLGETDNVGLAATGAQSQTLADVGVLIDVVRNGPLLQASLKGDLAYLKYLQNAFSGYVVGRFDGDASFALVPDHIKWVAQDSYGAAQVDALVSPARTNIERVNVISTGPDFLLRPSDNTFVRLGGRYALVNYETSPFNSHRVLGTASIGDELSVASSISLNADVTRIRFQNTTINSDYERRKFYLRYDTRGARTHIAVDAGVAEVNDTGPWNSKLLAQLVLTRDVTPFQSVSISGGRQFTDSADSFRSLTAAAAGGTIIASAVGAPGNYLNDYATAAWQFNKDRTRIDVSARWDRSIYTIAATALQVEDYILSGIPVGLNATRVVGGVRIQRDLTPILTAEGRAEYVHEDYLTLGFIDHSLLTGVSLTFKPSGRLQYRLQFDRTVRTADTVPSAAATVGLGKGYTEDIVFLTAVYRLSE
jgi:hypothetical protein